jgi:chromosome segregation ATPase
LCGELVAVEDTSRAFEQVIDELKVTPLSEEGSQPPSGDTAGISFESSAPSHETVAPLRSQLDDKDEELSHVKQALADSQSWLEETMRSALSSSTQFKALIQEKNQEIADLRLQMEENSTGFEEILQQQKVEILQMTDMRNDLTVQIKELRTHYEAVSERQSVELVELKSTNERLLLDKTETIRSFEGAFQDQNRQINNLQGLVERLKTDLAECEGFKSVIDNQGREIVQLNETIAALKDGAIESSSKLADMQKQVDQLTVRCNDSEEVIEMQRGEVERLRSELLVYESNHSSYGDATNNLQLQQYADEIKEMFDMVTRERDKLIDNMQGLRQQTDEAGRVMTNLEKVLYV